jgi:hypothetical protein
VARILECPCVHRPYDSGSEDEKLHCKSSFALLGLTPTPCALSARSKRDVLLMSGPTPTGHLRFSESNGLLARGEGHTFRPKSAIER